MASSPPTRAPSTTRGSLIWNRMARSSVLRLDGRWTNGILSASAAAVASGFRPAAPTRALTSAAAIRKTTAAPIALVFLQEDDLRPGLDDVLLGQLRVTAVGRLAGGVRDVLEAEQADYLADEH